MVGEALHEDAMNSVKGIGSESSDGVRRFLSMAV